MAPSPVQGTTHPLRSRIQAHLQIVNGRKVVVGPRAVYYQPSPTKHPHIWRRMPRPRPTGINGLGDAATDFIAGASSWLSPSYAFSSLGSSLSSIYSNGMIDWVSVGTLAVPVAGVALVAGVFAGSKRRRRR